jgi:hypothetical protein
MPPRPGVPRPKGVVRSRPALDARLELLVTLLAEARRVPGTLSIDDVVKDGLVEAGLGAAVDLALHTHIRSGREESKKDLEMLKLRLSGLVAAAELDGTQMMAS